MTYCLAIALEQGLVFASDSRTRTDADQISTNSKMHCYGRAGERQLVLLTSGGLAVSQAVTTRLERDLETADLNLETVDSIGAAADYVGGLVRESRARHGNGPARFILGGQIGTGPAEIMLIYAEGNHITSSRETPYLQIGESKYGKPVLDRFLEPGLSLDQAARCAVVSMDSTMRSNSLVGPPLEILLYERDSLRVRHRLKLDEDSDYLRDLRRLWDSSLLTAFQSLLPIPESEITAADGTSEA
jgi:putative proteasome-type protease